MKESKQISLSFPMHIFSNEHSKYFILAVGFWSLILEHVSTAEKTLSALVGRSVQGAKAHPLSTCEIMSALNKHYVLEFLQAYIFVPSVTPSQVFFQLD